MAIQVTNTLTGTKETFEPQEAGKVKMYVCGLTVYDYTHIGHARTYVAYDVMRRYLEHRGFDVLHVQNITDVEDKIIARAKENGEEPLALAERFTAVADEDLDRLGIKRAHHYPKVSDNIDGIVAMTQTLIDKGFAYATKDDHGTSVYYAVRKDDDYGKLSKRNLDDLREGVRKEVSSGKGDGLDFALWKSAKPGELSWPSPWGEGRPGWHIECSVMSTNLLGASFDIHGGGLDLIFPHHENELAQAESATGTEPFVKYWLHTGFLTVEGEKMSKSLGNFVTLRAALGEWAPEVLRLWLAGTHYRSPIDYSEAGLAQAASSLERIWTALRSLREALPEARTGDLASGDAALVANADGGADAGADGAFAARFTAAMDDDFNAPIALAQIFEAVRQSNAYVNATDGSQPHAEAVTAVHDWLVSALDIFGLVPPEEAADDASSVGPLIDLLLQVRQAARERKDFAQADTIRDELAALGFVIEDGASGAKWRRK